MGKGWRDKEYPGNGFRTCFKAGRRKRILAAAVGAALCCLVWPSAEVWADDGTTTASGPLYAGSIVGGNAEKTIFSGWDAGTGADGLSQVGTNYHYVVPGGGMVVFPSDCTYGTTGKTEGMFLSTMSSILGKSKTVWLNFMKTEYVNHGYANLVAVITVPNSDGTTTTQAYTLYTVTSTTTSTGTTYSGTCNMNSTALTNAIKSAYWNNQTVLTELAAATKESQSSDPATKAAGEAALQTLIENGIPKIYLATSSADWAEGEQLTYGTSTDGEVVNAASGVSVAASPITFDEYGGTLSASSSYSYDTENVAAGGVWRPLDRAEETSAYGEISIGYEWTSGSSGVSQVGTTSITVNSTDDTVNLGATGITVGTLTTGKGSTIDLSYLNTHYDIDGNYDPSDPIVSHNYTTVATGVTTGTNYEGTYPAGTYSDGSEYYRSMSRDLLVKNATLADDTTFRLGVYGLDASTAADTTTNVDSIGSTDAVYIENASTTDGNHANLYITLGYVPGLGKYLKGEASGVTTVTGNVIYATVLGILNGASNFTVTGKTSQLDGIYSEYQVTPVIKEVANYYTDSSGNTVDGSAMWYLDSYSYIDMNTASESGKTAADNNLVMENLWKTDYLNMFRRTGDMHRLALIPDPESGDQKENVWAETWHGQYGSTSGYGREVTQSYSGLQVGYDTLLSHEIHGGKVYAGIYASNVEGNSDTESGGGKQKSQGIGLYETWVGKNGHYLDAAIIAARMHNQYHLEGNTGSSIGNITGDYDTWGYGFGLQYGMHAKLKSDWYWEPSAALYAGWMDGLSYNLSNDLGIQLRNSHTLTGRIGIETGKQIDSKRGNIYAGVSAYHEFRGGTGVNEFYGTQTMAVDTKGGKDTWWQMNTGMQYRVSPACAFDVEFDKNIGSSIGHSWQINGGLRWSWGGPGKEEQKAKTGKNRMQPAEHKAGTMDKTATIVVGSAGKESAGTAKKAAVGNQKTKAAYEPVTAGIPVTQETAVPQTETAASRTETAAAPDTGTAYAGQETATPAASGAQVYALAPITVEASRPEWEKELSPGQVSVVYPAKFEGEQKDLPDLLERVPGLFIQKVSGTGHYTVARVRGSTAAEVAVYVDGVLMNLNGESAVNLSSIPVDNVERVEVYRGYVPARFLGAPMGGVINIVTKKPKEVGGTITEGFKSYGGYNATYQLTAPLGDGSLLATYQRDIWRGNFPFNFAADGSSSFGTFRRRSNGYQNNNGMLKWQDDHWMVKASYKDLHEQLPRSVANFMAGSNTGNIGYTDYYNKGYYDANQNILEKDFQIGRHDTIGNLDWGWKISYLDSMKQYRNTGLINGEAAGAISYHGWAPNPGEYWADYHSKKWDGNLNGSWKISGTQLLEFTADASHETMHAFGSDWSQSLFASNYSSNNPYSSDVMLTNYLIREYHLNLQDTFTLNEAGDFKVTAIGRADKVDIESLGGQDRHWKYSGGAALQKRFNDHWSIKSTWGTYNRHPNFYELFGDGASIQPNLEAAKFFGVGGASTWETGTQFDFSVNREGRMLHADTDTVLTWFERHSKNLYMLWTPTAPDAPSTYLPMDSGWVHGVELTHTMKWKRVSLELAGTWQKSRVHGYDPYGLDTYYTRSMTYMPQWVWNARVDYRFPGDKLSVYTEYHYTDRQFVGANYSSDADEYIGGVGTVNMGLKYSFSRRWQISGGVEDIFNAGYKQRMYEPVGKYGICANGLWGLIGVYQENMGTPMYPLTGRMYYMTMKYTF